MTDNQTNFARQLVKGKIAETIFAQMFRSTNNYTVLEFGYEKVIPELVQNGYNQTTGIVETLRTAPDFALIDNNQRHVKLVEVKYRHSLSSQEMSRIARRMHQTWNPSYLFVCTLDGFYFDSIEAILAHHGIVTALDTTAIPASIQNEFLAIVREFEAGK